MPFLFCHVSVHIPTSVHLGLLHVIKKLAFLILLYSKSYFSYSCKYLEGFCHEIDNFYFFNIKSDLSVCALQVSKCLRVLSVRACLPVWPLPFCLPPPSLQAASMCSCAPFACRQPNYLPPRVCNAACHQRVCLPPACLHAAKLSACRQHFCLLPSLPWNKPTAASLSALQPACLPQACISAASMSAYPQDSSCSLPLSCLHTCRQTLCLPLASLSAAGMQYVF